MVPADKLGDFTGSFGKSYTATKVGEEFALVDIMEEKIWQETSC